MIRLSQSERAIWTDAYKLHEQFVDLKNTDTDFERLYAALLRFNSAHGDTPLSRCLALALIDYFNEIAKKEAVT